MGKELPKQPGLDAEQGAVGVALGAGQNEDENGIPRLDAGEEVAGLLQRMESMMREWKFWMSSVCV